jgi:hypothetical protein
MVVRSAGSEGEASALRAVDAFIERFNARDLDGWRETLNYPHVRLASGAVAIANGPAEYAPGLDFERFSRATGWDHSVLDSAEVVQSFDDKVHIAVQFTRFRGDGSPIATYHALYVVTNQGGHWGIQCRSSSAP